VYPGVLGLCGDDAAVAEGVVQELEVGLLEERFGGALGVGGVGYYYVEGVFVVLEVVVLVDVPTYWSVRDG
jgi:hypothetical protein